MDEKKGPGPLFSIVVTSYNLEDYIAGTVASVTGQSFGALECIAVDDGSSDATVSRLREAAAADPRVTVIEAAHGGVSRARNLGLRAASGRYILFLDGDDTLDPDCLACCAEALDSAGEPADGRLLIFGIRNVDYDPSGITSVSESVPAALTFRNGHRFADWYAVHHALLLYSCGNKFYDLDLLRREGITFREDLTFGEDRLFNYGYLKVCGPIRSLSRCFYNYRHVNRESLSGRFRAHHIAELLSLSRAKTDTMLALADGIGEAEGKAFIRYDRCKEMRNAVSHLLAHAGSLTAEELTEEFLFFLKETAPWFGRYLTVQPSAAGHPAVARVNRLLFGEEDLPDPEEAGTVVILGSTACDYRVRRALSLFGSSASLFICSGGNLSAYRGPDGKFLKECDYMKSVLLRTGVEPERILTDDRPSCTWENIAFLSDTLKTARACVVTGGFHAARVRQILKEQGLSAHVVPAFGPNTRPDNWFDNITGLTVIFEELAKTSPEEAARAAAVFLRDLLVIG